MFLPITRCLGAKSYFTISILTAYKPVAVKLLVFMCTQLTNRTINVQTRIEKDEIVVSFHLLFFVFFFNRTKKISKKCKMVQYLYVNDL